MFQAVSKQKVPNSIPRQDSSFTKKNSVKLYPNLQTKLKLSQPGDIYEEEADRIAGHVMQTPNSKNQKYANSSKRENEEEINLHRKTKSEGNFETSDEIANEINRLKGSGSPLDAPTRSFMESKFGFDFGNIRIHTGPRAERSAQSVNARAYTIGSNIIFNKGEYAPNTASGQLLLAHELAHTIQQQAVPKIQQPAHQHSAIQVVKNEHRKLPPKKLEDGQEAAIHGRTSQTTVQRQEQQASPKSDEDTESTSKKSFILDGLASLAANIPGYTLLTVIIGRNPINMEAVDRSPLNILRGFMGLIPSGEVLFQILKNYSIAEKIANWIGAQIAMMDISYSSIHDAFVRFFNSLGWRDVFSPGDVFERAKNIFSTFITRINDFVGRLTTQAIAWLKEKFMQPLADFCKEIPGYKMVTLLLGHDPFTEAPVPRTPLNVVTAFAEFIPDGTEKVKQLQESKSLEKAYEWFIKETQARNLTWERISGTFASAWSSLELKDVLTPIETIARIGKIFKPLMSDLVDFAKACLIKLLELIYEAVMGAGGARVLAIIKKAQGTFSIVIHNPVGFLGNLVSAVKMGVQNFGKNILKHLQTGVIDWLTGTLAKGGVELPTTWDLSGILKMIMGILGITWAKIRTIAVKVFGPTVVTTLETAAGLVKDIKEKGFIQTMRDHISEYFSGLKDMILGKIKSFIQEKIVMKGIEFLASLLTPVGAVIQAIIKTYETIQFFIAKINEVLDFVDSIVDSISSIATGSLGQAAAFIEQTMARTIPLILDFMARLLGLGDIGEKIQHLIKEVQSFIEQKIEQGMMWIKTQVVALIQAGKSAVEKVVEWWKVEKPFANEDGENHTLSYSDSKENPEIMISSKKTKLDDYFDTMEKENKGNNEMIERIVAARDILKKYKTSKTGIKNSKDREAMKMALDFLTEISETTKKIKKATNTWPTGTPDDPIPIYWFKNKDTYKEEIDGKGPLDGYKFSNGQELRVHETNLLKEGVITKKVGRGGIGDKTEKVRTMIRNEPPKKNKKLFNFNIDKVSIDHVRDADFAGLDEYNNLWPLDKNTNDHANAVQYQYVRVKDTKTNKDEVHKVQDLKDKFFKIRQVKDTPAGGKGDHGTTKDNPANADAKDNPIKI